MIGASHDAMPAHQRCVWECGCVRGRVCEGGWLREGVPASTSGATHEGVGARERKRGGGEREGVHGATETDRGRERLGGKEGREREEERKGGMREGGSE